MSWDVDITTVYVDRSEMLDRLKDKTLLLAAITHYKDNPVDFINDWMTTYDPRVSPPNRPFILFPKQEDFINWLHDKWLNKSDALCEKSRDCGATWLSCAFAAWMWIFHDGQAISFGSRKEDLVDKVGDPKSILEKVRIIIRELPGCFVPTEFVERKHATFLKIVNPANGSTITGEAGDNIGRGGRSSIYFKDESAFYERPDKIEAALSQNSDVKIDISTPNGNGNPFFRKRFGGKFPVFTFHWRDDPRKDDAWYDKQKELLDPVILAQEVDIDYNASVSNVLIDATYVDAARQVRQIDIDPAGPVIFGVDVARYGDDRTVIACRQGRHLQWIETYSKMDTMETVGNVKRLIDLHAPDAVFVDVVGIGAGVYDRLREWFSNIYAINAGSKALDAPRYYNKRAECWGLMREWFRDEPVCIPNDATLMTDLCSLLYSYNSNGQLVLEKKEDAKKRGVKSPDIGDAIGLTFAEPVTYYDPLEEYEENYEIGRNEISGY